MLAILHVLVILRVLAIPHGARPAVEKRTPCSRAPRPTPVFTLPMRSVSVNLVRVRVRVRVRARARVRVRDRDRVHVADEVGVREPG